MQASGAATAISSAAPTLMSEAAESPSRLPTLAIATIGHHRHGKTTLTAAITRVLARRAGAGESGTSVEALDRRGGSPPLELVGEQLVTRPLPEAGGETLTVRGCSLRYETTRRAFAHFDAPGRRPWLGNVARALGAADAALLVVSAPDSVQPQTREHLQLAYALGIRQVVVFVSKCDRVTDLEWLDLVERDVRDLLNRCGFDGDATRILRGAARPAYAGERAWEASVLDLIEALETELVVPVRRADGEPLLFLDRVLGRRPGGVLVEGRLVRGELVRGGSAWLHSARPQTVRLVEIECYRRKSERAVAGDQIGLILRGIDRDLERHSMRSGDAVIRAQAPPVVELTAQIELLSAIDGGRHTPLMSQMTAQLVFGAARVMGTFMFGGIVMPGEGGTVGVTLSTPVHLEEGMHFALRDGSQGPNWRQGQAPTRAGLVGAGTILSVRRADVTKK